MEEPGGLPSMGSHGVGYDSNDLAVAVDCKEMQPVHPKGDQSWVFIGRTDAKPKLQYFGHLM